MKRVLIGIVALMVTTPGLTQGYGIRTSPKTFPKRIPTARSDTGDAYDRAIAGWRHRRDACLYGRASAKSTRLACADIMREREPLPSDFVEAPPAG